MYEKTLYNLLKESIQDPDKFKDVLIEYVNRPVVREYQEYTSSDLEELFDLLPLIYASRNNYLMSLIISTLPRKVEFAAKINPVLEYSILAGTSSMTNTLLQWELLQVSSNLLVHTILVNDFCTLRILSKYSLTDFTGSLQRAIDIDNYLAVKILLESGNIDPEGYFSNNEEIQSLLENV